MKRSIFALALGILALAFPAPSRALPPAPAKTIAAANEVLDELVQIPAKSIPLAILDQAAGVAIIPNTIKAGFVFGGRAGHGVVLVREKDGTWSDPLFVNLGGASVGFQIGVESTDVVLVFRNRRSLDRFLEGKNKFTLGADASVAAGPLGRKASASTDAKLEAEILSYSRSRGLFAGVSLDGAVINPAAEANAVFAKTRAKEDRKIADDLRNRLAEMSSSKPVVEIVPNPNPVPRSTIPIPPPAPAPMGSTIPSAIPTAVPSASPAPSPVRAPVDPRP